MMAILLALVLQADLQAGAARIDITPEKLPVLVNGGFLSRSCNTVKSPLHARSLCLTDGKVTLAIVVVDSCMVPRPVADKAKALAREKTGIPADRMLVAATHTHTAPSAMGALGTAPDTAYVPFLVKKIAEAIASAHARLEPAEIGIVVPQAPDHTALRRWVRRPDRVDLDPFGNRTVRATMHAASNWDNVTGPSGPEDPDLSLVSVRRRGGRPLAVLGNYSMHYFGTSPLSDDYFGLFSEGLKKRLAPDGDFVGMLSHGCSGDAWRRDYQKPTGERRDNIPMEQYTDELLDIAVGALENVKYRSDVTLAMAEARPTLNYRVPDAQRLEWAKRIVAEMGDRPPKTRPEVYAREQVILHERGSTEVVLQAVRIGGFALATTPTETYALTGLKIKAQSPLQPTVVFDLTNGGDGYIPPPEQHPLGGYNTWAARSAGLEVRAEPKMTETLLQLLEQVSGKPRRVPTPPKATAIMAAKPAAFWRLDDFAGRRAVDGSGHDRDGLYEDGVVFYLEGATPGSRAAHFAGGRMEARVALGKDYSVSLHFWNGMPDGAREIAGWMFGRRPGEELGLAGTGELRFGGLKGTSKVPRWTWAHVVLVREGIAVRLYLDGKLEAEGKVPSSRGDRLFVGGRFDGTDNWEGRLDDVAVFDRALGPEDVARLAGSK